MITIKKIVVFVVIICSVVFVQSCECVVKPPCNGEFSFKVVNRATHQDLVFGPNAVYSVDSIKMLNTNDTIPPSFVTQGFNHLDCYINGTGDTLYLKLNASDIDTLLLSFRNTRHTTCCPSGGRVVTGIRFNNIQTQQDSSVFILEK